MAAGWGVLLNGFLSGIILFVDTFLKDFIDLVMIVGIMEVSKVVSSPFQCRMPFIISYAPSHNNKGPTDFCGMLVCLRRGEEWSSGASLLGPQQMILSLSHGSLMAYGI